MRLTEFRTDPRPVAIARIGIGLATILNLIEAYLLLSHVAEGKLAMPVLISAPLPTLAWSVALVALGVVAAVAVTIGWKSEAAAIVSVLVGVAVLLWDQQTYSSHRWLATLLMAYLIFARAGTSLSVRPAKGRLEVVWWPQLLMMTQLSVVYLFSALSKLNLTFLSGAPLSGWVWIDLPWQFYTVAAVMTIIVELIIAVALWFPSSRRVAVILGLGLHLSIVTLLNHETFALIAFALTCVSLYPLFLFRPGVRAWRARADLNVAASNPATSA